MNEQLMPVSPALAQRGNRGGRDRAKSPVVVGLGRHWSGFCRIALLFLCLCFPSLQTPGQSVYATAYTFTTLAGYSGSGSVDGVGNNARFYQPGGVAADGAGNVYVADTLNVAIRKITPAGVVSTLAGSAGAYGSDDGTGSDARFGGPRGVAVDSAGDVYVADTYNYTIRKITPAGVVSTLAGLAGSHGSADGTGSNARFYYPQGVAVDSATNVYVADMDNHTIRKITPIGTNWVVSTLAGLAGRFGWGDGTGTNARFFYPNGVAVDSTTNVYVADSSNSLIRKITPAGVVSTWAGQVANHGPADGTSNNAQFYYPTGVAVDNAGNVYVADLDGNTIRKITPAAVVTTLAGRPVDYDFGTWMGPIPNTGSADGTTTNAQFNYPNSVAVDSAGNVYVADIGNSTIRKVTSAGVVSTLAGLANSGGSVDGVGSNARFSAPHGIASDGAGNVYVADRNNYTIRKVTSAGEVTTVAGLAGTNGSADGVGSNARFSTLQGVAADSAGNVYVTDGTIRKVTPAGVVSTLAGGNSCGSCDGTGTNAGFTDPRGVAVDSTGYVYVADSGNHTIRKITPAGVVSTLAGLAGTSGNADGTGSNARFLNPLGIAVDSAGNVYVADGNNTVRKITAAGEVSTLAGGNACTSCDGTGTNAGFSFYNNFYYTLPGYYCAAGIAVDGAGNVYVPDTYKSMIRKVTPAGVVSTVAGRAGANLSIDGTGSNARFYFPNAVAADSAGNLYVADTFNNTIRAGVFTQYSPTNPVPYTPPQMNGQIAVTLLPPEANGQWRFPWDLAWRNSGDVASNLVAGNYTIEFRNVPGYLAYPPMVTAAVTNGVTTQATNQYYPTVNLLGTTNTGALTVNIGPSAPSGAGWRFLGETVWRSPASTASNLLPGTYAIEFAPVSGYSKPASQAVQALAGSMTLVWGSYLLAQSPPAGVMLPMPVPTNSIRDLTDYPYGFNGQLQSDVGYGSGVAVQTNVVLTAAHLVFNDQTLSYVSQVYWRFRQEAGVFMSQPQAARGWYVLGGYAAQRTNDVLGGLGPDQSSPQSRNLDVAALYFPSPVAGGGYGGYLPSDASLNPWLAGNTPKMLVGYPVDGAVFGDASIVPGVMYQTGPQPYPLSLATDPVSHQQVYTAPWFLSYPGNSGGPLYVQYNGYYYPAGVYLGTLYNGVVPYASLVRGIDSNVVNLITRAQTLGDAGTNGTGGGVITIIAGGGSGLLAYLQVPIGPADAVAAGAAWRVQGTTDWSTGPTFTATFTNGESVTLEYKPIAGWNLPPNNTVQAPLGTLTVVAATYTPNPAQMAVIPARGLASSGYAGGPFSPAAITYTLTNSGGADLNWSASKAANWLSLSASSGTLAGGASTNVQVSISANANSLAPGNYTDTVGFTNLSNGLGNTTRSVSLSLAVHPPVLLSSVRRLTNGAIAMTLQGVAGGVYSTVASTNLHNPLANWTEVLRLTNTTGQTVFTNPPPPSSPQYYRAKELLVTLHPLVQFTGVRVLTNGAIAMTLQGATGGVYSIIASTNLLNPLTNWTEVLRLTNTSGQTVFTNPPPVVSSQYYRAKEL